MTRQPLGRADFEQRCDGSPEPLGNRRRREAAGLEPFTFGEPIGLVENKDELVRVVCGRVHELGDELELVVGERRVCAEYDESGVDVRNECLRPGGALGKDGAEARGVDEADARLEDRMWKRDLDRRNAFAVGRIAALGNVRAEVSEWERLRRAVEPVNRRASCLAMANDGDDRRDGNYAGRENGLREEGVQERGLAALKLPDAGNVEPSLGDAFCEGTGFRSEWEELQLGGDPSERFKTA